MTKRIALVAIVIAISIPAIGQNQIICRVIDQETKKPVKEATVLIQNKNIETTTNFLGYFQIVADSSDYLVIEKSFYEPGVVKAPSQGVQIQITKRKHSDYEGGLEEFVGFMQRNIRYPKPARMMGTEGTFYVSFTIDSLGQLANINTIMDIGSDCGLEVVELLKRVPHQWIPAETTTTFILPVTFKLSDPRIKPKEIELPEGVLLKELVVTAIPVERIVR